MRKIVALTLFLFTISHISLSQSNIEKKFNEAKEAFDKGDFKTVVSIIKEIKPLYKEVPTKVLHLEITAKYQILKQDPLNDYSLLEETRKLTHEYLLENKRRENDKYKSIKSINDALLNYLTYPKDEATFNSKKEALEKEAVLKKEKEKKLAEETRIQKEKEAEAIKKRLEEERLRKKDDEKRDAIAKAKAEEERKLQLRDMQLRLEKELERQRIELNRQQKERDKQQKKERKKLKSFSSLGIQSGEIARYGLLYERGGKSVIGWHMSYRTSLTPDNKITKDVVLANKMEVDLGPNFRISKRIYLNLGMGYGQYKFINHNEYTQVYKLDRAYYLESSVGLMFRVNRIISLNVGASFIDIDKDIYTPELTYGLAFNLKRRSK